MQDSTRARDDRGRTRAAALAAGATALGGLVPATATGQDGGGGDSGDRRALMFGDEFRTSAVFRVASPPLEDAPRVEDDALAGRTTRVIEYYNTGEEAYLFVPEDVEVEQGQLYELEAVPAPLGERGARTELVRVRFRTIQAAERPFDVPEDQLDLLEGGGEAAVRPRNFSAGGLFRVTSGPQGWVPEDVADSGFFTDYDTHHAEYLGVDDAFPFFPQEGASAEAGRLYVMWDEFEFFTPDGNLVAAAFDPVDEESVDVDAFD